MTTPKLKVKNELFFPFIFDLSIITKEEITKINQKITNCFDF